VETGFEEAKARCLEEIETGGGFTSLKTLRVREYLDKLIAAQVAVEQPDSLRAQMARQEQRSGAVETVKPTGPAMGLMDGSPEGTHPQYQESCRGRSLHRRTSSSDAVRMMNVLLIELTRSFVTSWLDESSEPGTRDRIEAAYRNMLTHVGMTDPQAQTDFLDSIGFSHLGDR